MRSIFLLLLIQVYASLQPPVDLRVFLKIDYLPFQRQFYVDLSWQPNPSEEAVLYKIYRNGLFVGETKNLSYIDQLIQRGLIYSYEVKAVDELDLESEPAMMKIYIP